MIDGAVVSIGAAVAGRHFARKKTAAAIVVKVQCKSVPPSSLRCEAGCTHVLIRITGSLVLHLLSPTDMHRRL